MVYIIETCHKSYPASCQIPAHEWGHAATCYTIRGLRRRYREERAGVSDGGSWLGHVRAFEIEPGTGKRIPMDRDQIEAAYADELTRGARA